MPKKYYFAKVHESFFSDGAILELRALKDGNQLIVLYLLLLLRTLNTNGYLLRDDGKPLSIEALAVTSAFKPSYIEAAIKKFQEYGLVEIVGDCLHMTCIDAMVGYTTEEAQRKADKRANKKPYGVNSNVMLTDQEYDTLLADYPTAQEHIDAYSHYLSTNGSLAPFGHYTAVKCRILRNLNK